MKRPNADAKDHQFLLWKWDDPNHQIWLERDKLILVWMPTGERWTSVEMSYADARILARRINQCLDATTKK